MSDDFEWPEELEALEIDFEADDPEDMQAEEIDLVKERRVVYVLGNNGQVKPLDE